MTPYRNAVFTELKKLGYRILIGPTSWPGYMRDHYIARTKVCLQVRQDPRWAFPSVMRYHYLLCSGSVVAGEKATESCMQEDHLVMASPEDFVRTCMQLIKNGNFSELGRSACESYFEASASGREYFRTLVSEVTGETYPELHISDSSPQKLLDRGFPN